MERRPISPASLPPPPTPVLGPLGNCVTFDVWAQSGKGSLESCRAKALAAVAAQQGFRFAEITGTGLIAGYTNTARIVVYVASARDEPAIFVLVANRHREGKGMAAKIGDRISWADYDSKQRTCMGTPDPELDCKLLPIHLHIEAHSNSMILYRNYMNAASLNLEKQGFETQRANTNSTTFLKREVLPAGLLKPARRNLNPWSKREDSMLISSLEKDGMGTTLMNTGLLSVFDGPKGETVNYFYASTSNAGDFARLPLDLSAISAATWKMLFE